MGCTEDCHECKNRIKEETNKELNLLRHKVENKLNIIENQRLEAVVFSDLSNFLKLEKYRDQTEPYSDDDVKNIKALLVKLRFWS